MPTLNVAINKPVKDNLCKEWHFWMSNSSVSISDDIIVYSFKKCGISNTLDGLEDDAIYEFLREIENERKEEELEIVDMDNNDDSE
ncbi:unnamed protein product [Rhizophagus irregularis]|nr:unnamed protein product [Rhizophagus irregularis]